MSRTLLAGVFVGLCLILIGFVAGRRSLHQQGASVLAEMIAKPEIRFSEKAIELSRIPSVQVPQNVDDSMIQGEVTRVESFDLEDLPGVTHINVIESEGSDGSHRYTIQTDRGRIIGGQDFVIGAHPGFQGAKWGAGVSTESRWDGGRMKSSIGIAAARVWDHAILTANVHRDHVGMSCLFRF